MNQQRNRFRKVRLTTFTRMVEKVTQSIPQEVRKVNLTAFTRMVERIAQPVSQEAGDTIVIGTTNRKVFWPVLLAGLFIMGTMVYMVGRNSIALAAVALPVEFTITADSIDATNFSLIPGTATSDGKTPVAVVKMDGKITNQVITKKIGPVTVKISAGGNGTPVSVTGLTVDASSINANTAQFQNLDLTTGSAGDSFQQAATSETLTNATINAPYLLANSISLPGLSVSLSIS